MPVPEGLRCDVSGCPEEADLQVGSEKRCFTHALERANEERRAAGRAPLVATDEGTLEPMQ